MEKELRLAANAIKNAKALLITAGAGMGVDSGLPDFRGPEGFWKAYPPIKEKGLKFPEVSTPRWFFDDPAFAWGFYGHRLNLYRNTEPHSGFQILRRWAEKKSCGYFIYTSNVDGHFQRAGFHNDNIVECHGSINFMQLASGEGNIWPIPENLELEIDESTLNAKESLPTGPPGAPNQELARPNVLMFNDYYWISDRTDVQESKFSEWFTKVSQEASVVIEIGAGLAVPTVRDLSENFVRLSKNSSTCLIRINPNEPNVPFQNSISLRMKGLDALNKLDQLIEGS